MMKYYMPKYHLLRKEQNIPLKILSTTPITEKLPIAEIRRLPEAIAGKVAVNIFGDNAALIMWNPDNPFAILIREKEVADTFRSYFEYLWNLVLEGDIFKGVIGIGKEK